MVVRKSTHGAPLSGYLHKKSRGGSWQKRFFDVNGHYLNYYKDKSKSALLASVDCKEFWVDVSGEIQ
jgi:hypothetical protein